MPRVGIAGAGAVFAPALPRRSAVANSPPSVDVFESVSPPKRKLLEHPLFSALDGDKRSLLAAPAKIQDAVLTQFQHFPAAITGRTLLRLLDAPWFRGLGTDDQIRAVKIFAFASSQLVGANFEDRGVSQRKIIENTLGAFVGPKPRFSLELRDLPFGEDDSVNGYADPPRRVVLNRLAIPADGEPVSGLKEEHVALSTLVHETNHIANPQPAGPTYLAFQDEYRAWFSGFVAMMGRFPSRIEALARIQALFNGAAYPELRAALLGKTVQSAELLRFMKSFGPVETAEDVLRLSIDDYVSRAPLPAPLLAINNG